jgi:hypothetical protein
MQLTHSPQGWPKNKPPPQLVSWWSTIIQWVCLILLNPQIDDYIFASVLVFIFNHTPSSCASNVCCNFSFLVLDHTGCPLVWNAFLDSSFCKFDLDDSYQKFFASF